MARPGCSAPGPSPSAPSKPRPPPGAARPSLPSSPFPSCPSLGSGNGRAEAAGPPALARLEGRGEIAGARAWGEAPPHLAGCRAPPATVPVLLGEGHRGKTGHDDRGNGQGGNRRALQTPAGARGSQLHGQRTRYKSQRFIWLRGVKYKR